MFGRCFHMLVPFFFGFLGRTISELTEHMLGGFLVILPDTSWKVVSLGPRALAPLVRQVEGLNLEAPQYVLGALEMVGGETWVA